MKEDLFVLISQIFKAAIVVTLLLGILRILGRFIYVFLGLCLIVFGYYALHVIGMV